MYIVIVTKGKGYSSPDSAWVQLFSNRDEALKYVHDIQDIKGKYWTKAELVEESETVDLIHPHYD